MLVTAPGTITGSAQIAPGVVEGTDIANGAITNDKVNAAAAIVDTKLAQIATASKVSGAALTSLNSIPAGAGVIPAANAPEVTTLQKTLTAGDPLTAGDAVAISDGGTDNVLVISTGTAAEVAMGRTTLRLKQREDLAAGAILVPFNKITTTLKKYGAPADNLLIRCYAADGTTLIATATKAGADITTSFVSYTLTLDAPATKLTRFIEFSRDGAMDNTNYYAIATAANDADYGDGTFSRWDGSNWTSENVDGCITLLKTITAGEAIMASGKDAAWATTFIGFANANVAAGGTVTVNVSGVQTGLSGLTAGVQYHLADIGGTLAAAAGSVTRKAAIGFTTTSALITNIW